MSRDDRHYRPPHPIHNNTDMNEQWLTPQEMKDGEKKRKRKRYTLLGVIAALAIGRITYSLIHHADYAQTALLFIGIPLLIALGTTFSPPSRTALGVSVKTTFLSLSLAGILLPEGMVCLLMSAPLFLVVTYLGAKLGEKQMKSRMLALIPLTVLMSDALVADRYNVVTVQEQLPLSAETITTNLANEWQWDHQLPTFTKLGFPTPIQSEGDGLAVGDTRTVTFVQEGNAVTMTWEVIEQGDNFVRFENVHDETAIANWLTWESAVIEWQPAANGETQVTWTVEYERHLDPALYFSPLQRVIMERTIEYLIDAVLMGDGGNA